MTTRLSKQELICLGCGKPFHPTASPRNPSGWSVHCSQECRYKVLNSRHPSKELLEQLYLQDKLSLREITDKVGYSNGALTKIMQSYNIPFRSRSESVNLAVAKGRQFIACREKHHAWKGDNYRTKNSYGYVLVRIPKDYPYHECYKRKGEILEHILIWEQEHNQELPRGWNIHHINGIKDDNRPENLIAIPGSKHTKKHISLTHKRIQHIQNLEARVTQLEADLTLLRATFESKQAIFYIDSR